MNKKILVVTDSYYKELGGSYEAVGSTVYNLRKQGLSVNFIYLFNGESRKKIKIRKVLKKFEIIHFYGIWTFQHIRWMLNSLILKKKIIITPMGALEPWSLKQKSFKKKVALCLYQKYFLKKASVIHCTSYNEEKNIKKIDQNINTVIIPHGQDGTKYIKTKVENLNNKKMLFFSRIHEKKGLETLINLWGELKPKNWILDIIGPEGDSTKKKLNQIILERNLEKEINFKEPVYKIFEKKKLFESYDISVLLSKNENFAFSILESLRHSLPVITTNNTPWDQIKTYNAGWFIDVEKDDVKEIFRKIFQISNEELLEKSKNAYKLSMEYTWDKIYPKFEKVYLEL